jgi:arylsulfatase A-like enzyme
LLLGALAVLIVLPRVGSPSIAAQGEPPNVVLILTDDQDYDSLPAMRNLMRRPQGSWINFVSAFVSDSICCPSRATLLTGQYSFRHGVTANNLGGRMDDTNTLPVWLDDAGYTTGLIGKYLNNIKASKGKNYVPPGWDYFWSPEEDPGVDAHTAKALEFLQSAQAGNMPFFLYLAYKAPHKPAMPPARYADADVYIPPDRPNFNEADVSDKPGWVRKLPLLTTNTIQKWRVERLRAQRELLAIDDGVQSIIDALRASGELDNTLLIFMSDNGMSWGNHRRLGKWCPYEECSHVPLFIRYPSLVGNREEPRMVASVDIVATIAEYTGVATRRPQDGRSLVSLIERPAGPWTEAILLERHVGSKYYGIRTPAWKYIEYIRGSEEELYDLRADPFELNNVANRPETIAIQQELARRLHLMLGTYAIKGRVTTADGQPVYYVTLSTGGANRTDRTDANGYYDIRGLPPGNYTLTITKRNYKFDPASPRITISDGDVTQNVIGTPP